jgi:hypothetical protein
MSKRSHKTSDQEFDRQYKRVTRRSREAEATEVQRKASGTIWISVWRRSNQRLEFPGCHRSSMNSLVPAMAEAGQKVRPARQEAEAAAVRAMRRRAGERGKRLPRSKPHRTYVAPTLKAGQIRTRPAER